MADTTDSKSVARKGVRVQVPPRALGNDGLYGISSPHDSLSATAPSRRMRGLDVLAIERGEQCTEVFDRTIGVFQE